MDISLSDAGGNITAHTEALFKQKKKKHISNSEALFVIEALILTLQPSGDCGPFPRFLTVSSSKSAAG